MKRKHWICLLLNKIKTIHEKPGQINTEEIKYKKEHKLGELPLWWADPSGRLPLVTVGIPGGNYNKGRTLEDKTFCWEPSGEFILLHYKHKTVRKGAEGPDAQ